MKLKEGDVFTIPIDHDRVGLGQIVSIPSKNNFLIIVFRDIVTANGQLRLEDIIPFNGILFMGFTMDAKLYHKDWGLIGNYKENLSAVELPYYKLGTIPGDIYVLDHLGKEIRKCTKQEFEKLNYKKVIAPIRYEKALRAFYNLEDWREDYEDLLIENVLSGKHAIESKIS